MAPTYLQMIFGTKHRPACLLPSWPEASWCRATRLRTHPGLPGTSGAKDRLLRAPWRFSRWNRRTTALNVCLLSASLLGFPNLFPPFLPTFLSLCTSSVAWVFLLFTIATQLFVSKCSPFFGSSPSSPTPNLLLLICNSKPLSLGKAK